MNIYICVTKPRNDISCMICPCIVKSPENTPPPTFCPYTGDKIKYGLITDET